jgi:hypothetical protein
MRLPPGFFYSCLGSFPQTHRTQIRERPQKRGHETQDEGVFENSSVLAYTMLETDSKSCVQRTLQVGGEVTTVITQPMLKPPRNAIHHPALVHKQREQRGQESEQIYQ